MRGIWGLDPGWGITAVRVAMAVILIAAGYQKWFQFGVFTGVTKAFTNYGLPVPAVFALLAALIELVGGIAVLLGLFARWIGALIAIEFVIATSFVRFPAAGFGGSQLELMLLAGGLLLLLAGPGKAALAWGEKEGVVERHA